jgi:histidine ammonia-lyase
LTHVETIVAIELLAAAQGIDFRRRDLSVDRPNSLQMGAGTAVALASAVGHYHLARSIPDPSVVSATETALTGEV